MPWRAAVVPRDVSAPLKQILAAIVAVDHYFDKRHAIVVDRLRDRVVQFALAGHATSPAVSVVAVEPLPATAEAAIAILKKHGG